MRVFKQEIYKSFMRPSVAVLLILSLVLNVCFLSARSAPRLADTDADRKAFAYISRLPKERRLPFVETHLAELSGTQGDEHLLFAPSVFAEITLLQAMKKQLLYQESYPEYLANIQRQARPSEISILQNTTEYTLRDAEMTARAFRGLGDRELTFVNSAALLEATESGSCDVIALLFLLYLVISLVIYEKQQGLYRLFCTTRNGRASLAGAKIILVLLVAALSAALFWGSSLAVSAYRNKPLDLNAPLQSVLGYGSSALPVTIGQYWLIFLAGKMLVYAFVGMLALVFTLKAKGFTSLYSSVLLTFFLAFVLRLTIPGNSLFSVLHYVNLLPFLQVYPIFKYYFNLDLAGRPVPMMSLFWGVSALLLSGLMGYTLHIFADGQFTDSLMRGKRLALRHKPPKVKTSLLGHEAYKLLVTHKGLFLFVLLFSMQMILARQTVPPDRQELCYQNYMQEFSGAWTEAKEKRVEEERSRFAKLQLLTQETERKFAAHEISEAEKKAVLNYISGEMEPYRAFQRVLTRLAAMKAEKNSARILVYETGYLQIFGKGYKQYQDEFLQAILLNSALIVLMTAFTAGEYSSGMVKIIRTLPRGRLQTLHMKLGLGLASAVLLFIMSYLPYFLAIRKTYPLGQLYAPLGAIPEMRNVLYPALPLWAYLLILYALRLLMCGGTVCFGMALATRIKQGNQAILLALALCVLPMAIRLLGVYLADYVSLNAFYSGNLLFERIPGPAALLLSPVPIFFLGVPLLYLRRQWAERGGGEA